MLAEQVSESAHVCVCVCMCVCVRVFDSCVLFFWRVYKCRLAVYDRVNSIRASEREREGVCVCTTKSIA